MPLRGFLGSYIALVSHLHINKNHVLTSQVNSFGQLLSAGVFQGISQSGLTGQWSYRIPFAVQWVWIVPLFLIITFAPESPWFLVRRGRLEEAERTVKRLGSTTENRDPSQVVAMMVSGSFSPVLTYQVRTNEHEKADVQGTSYLVSLLLPSGGRMGLDPHRTA